MAKRQIPMRFKLASLAFPLSLSALFVGISTTGAHAYLDAGTGSMILQVLLGGVAGLAIAGKLYWYKLLSFFGVKPKATPAEAPDDEALARSKVRADR
jgi:hypothetical protein